MKVDRLESMVRGWFVGDFEPTLLRTNHVEVAVKHYEAGDSERGHYHAIATELTVVVVGAARMNGRDLLPGDIVTVRPGEPADFTALEPTILVAVKIPGASNDKYELA